MFSVAEGNHMLATNGCVHSRWFHTSERTTYAVSASSYHLDVKSSQLSSPTDVIYTISLASGSSNVVNFQDGSWPTIPAPELVQPYPKAPENKLLRKQMQVPNSDDTARKCPDWGWGIETLKMMRRLIKQRKCTWKSLFQDDLDTSSEDIYADINMHSKTDSLSVWGTEEDGDQIMI